MSLSIQQAILQLVSTDRSFDKVCQLQVSSIILGQLQNSVKEIRFNSGQCNNYLINMIAAECISHLIVSSQFVLPYKIILLQEL